jgi:glutamate decarboxylase
MAELEARPIISSVESDEEEFESDVDLLSDVNGEDEDESESFRKSPKAVIPRNMKPFISVAVEAFHGKLFERVFSLLLKKGLFFNGAKEREEAPYNFKDPAALQKIMKFGLGRNGVDDEAVFRILEQVIQFSPHNSHPFKLTAEGSGLDPYGIAADWMASTMTACILTYLYAPVFTLMEMNVLQKVREIIGYAGGKGDGAFSTDGGHASCMAISLALKAKYPLIKSKGLHGVGSPRAVLFVSEGASLSIFRKYAIFCGLGVQGVVPVKVDKYDRMRMDSLEDAIQASLKDKMAPFMVVGNLGTKAFGAIDPLDQMSVICKNHGLWFHVRANHGSGSWLISDKRRKQLTGIEKSDSVSWTHHPGLGAPCCSTVIVTSWHQEAISFASCFGLGAKLVFEDTYLYDGKWLIQYDALAALLYKTPYFLYFSKTKVSQRFFNIILFSIFF